MLQVVLVIGGGAATFERVRDALDPGDPATGTSVPVLVVTNTGGAATDIAYYVATGTFMWHQMSSTFDFRTLGYRQAAEKYLPEILALGKQTGVNTSKQLSFCTVAAEMVEDSSSTKGARATDLATAVQQALLNDCPNAVEETLLTIQWGSDDILQQKLHDEKTVVEIQRSVDESKGDADETGDDETIEKLRMIIDQEKLKGSGGKKRLQLDLSRLPMTDPLYKRLTQPSVLQLALSYANIEVVRCLYARFETPATVRLDELFEARYNRYPIQDTMEMWKPRHELLDIVLQRYMQDNLDEQARMRVLASDRLSPSQTRSRMRDFGGLSPLKAGEAIMGGAQALVGAGEALAETAANTTKKVAKTVLSAPGNVIGGVMNAPGNLKHAVTDVLSQVDAAGLSALGLGDGESHMLLSPSCEVLQAMVSGYEEHIKARGEAWLPRRIAPPFRLPTWLDIMMWAVLAGHHELAELTWPRTEYPLRAALLASQLCKKLASEDECAPDRKMLIEQSIAYEVLASNTLGAVREPAVAYALLARVPWELADEVARRREHSGEQSRFSEGEGDHGVKSIVPIWDSSVLEEASTADKIKSFPCMHFVAHRHSQETLDKFFSGNYPDSGAQIEQGATLFGIILQALLPILPGTIIEVDSVGLRNVGISNASAEEDTVEDDEQQALREVQQVIDAAKDKAQSRSHLLASNMISQLLEEEVTDLKADISSWRFLAFYNVPKVKFAVDFAFYILFVVQLTVLATSLRSVDTSCGIFNATCAPTDPGYLHVDATIGWNEVVFWVWTLCRFIGEIDNIKSWDWDGWVEYTSDTWNQQDVLFSLITAVIAGVRIWISGRGEMPDPNVDGTPMHVLASLPIDLYAVLVVMNYYRVLRYLAYYESVGVLTLVVNFMLIDVGVFATLLFLITIGFGFAFAVLQPQQASEQGFEFILGNHPIWSSWWGLFGDYDRQSMYAQMGSQQPMATLAPLFLWVYEFFSVVLLMNLLVALMSDTYARVTAEGELRWKYARAQLIREYLTQSPLPAPLNIFYYLFYSMPRFLWRKYRIIYYHVKPLEISGFTFMPTQKILASLRRAEQDAVRKFQSNRQQEDRREASFMAEATQAKLDKLTGENTLRFEAINQRIDLVLRRITDVQQQGSKAPETDLEQYLDDLSWSAPLDKIWHAPPAFTAADHGSTVVFSSHTWPLQKRLHRLTENALGGGGQAADKLLEGRPALATATITRPNGSREERMLAWRGDWSGETGGFAKAEFGNAETTGALKIKKVDEDAVMGQVTLETLAAQSDRTSEALSMQSQRPLIVQLQNPERFPNTERIRALAEVEAPDLVA